jgi:hypothetical protein
VSRTLALLLTSLGAAAALAGCGSNGPEAGSGAATTTSEATVTTPEQAVLVHLKNTDIHGVFAIEDSLEPAVSEAGVGEYDGNEVAVDGSEAVLYAYGPDADALWNVMRPIVESANPPEGSYVIKRYGEASDPAAKEVRVELGRG